MTETMIETFQNDRDILSFWSQLQFQDFEEWLSIEQKITTTTAPKTTITTVTSTYAALPNPDLVTTTQVTTTTSASAKPKPKPSLPSPEIEQYKSFCYEQKLAFCTNCEPICTIHINCMTHNICYDGTPFDQTYWTPLINICCSMCNPFVSCQTEMTAQNFESEILMLGNVSSTSSNEVTGSPGATSKTQNTKSEIDGLVSDGDSNVSTETDLKYILPPIISVVLLGFIVSGFYYYIKLRNRKSKYSDVSQTSVVVTTTTTTSTTGFEDEIPDITNVPLTELWERIKTDENYKPKKSGTSRQAPLAAVLHSRQ